MKVTKAKLKAIINEELQAELNEGFFSELKSIAMRLFGIRKPTKDSKKYLERLEAAIREPRFKGYPSICNREHVWCLEKNIEKDKCSQYCGKNPNQMKAKIAKIIDLAKSANRAA